MGKIFIAADDLTGANDTAIQFVKQGLSGLVIVNSETISAGLFDKYDVVSINSDSRRLNAAESYKIVYEIVKQFEAGSLVYKKMDSVLRGNPGQELGAVMDALGTSLALAAPSFPANRSTVENGLLNGKTNAVHVFANGTGRKTESIPLEKIRRGIAAVLDYINIHNETEIFVADALTDDDLEIVFKTSSSLGRHHVLAGSAGLANQLARHLGKATIVQEKSSKISPVLIIAGTRQVETAAQITALCNTFPGALVKLNVGMIAKGETEKAVAMAFDETSLRMQRGTSAIGLGAGSKQSTGICIIAVESMFTAATSAGKTVPDYTEGDETSIVICEALGILAEKLMALFKFQVILSTGGDTSLAVCRQLGINAIEPLTEICPGIPLGRIRAGLYNGHFIVTKSGRFGNLDAMVEIIHYLGAPQ
ncbi:MAG: hypothetical protein LBH42_10465 [Treponema sp.]|jgi:uncharacterized protein YgbK (DUF1537 family)|nr:hypothetical protein [Treponema sp.]